MADTLVVNAHPVDDGPVLNDPEKPRLGIAVLRFRCQGAYFDEAEAEVGQFIVMASVLVQPSGKADRISEAESEDCLFKSGRVCAEDGPDYISGKRDSPQY